MLWLACVQRREEGVRRALFPRRKYDAWHIPEAVLIPYTELRQRLNEVPRDKPVYTFCRSGFRSYIACCALRQNGWRDVAFLSGGMMTYHGFHRTPLKVGKGGMPMVDVRRGYAGPAPRCACRCVTPQFATNGHNESEVCTMGDTPVEVALSIRAQHAEGPLWDAATARLWWVDIAGERVHCFDPESSNDSSWSTSGQPGGVILGASGVPVVASPKGLATLDRSTGKMHLYVPIEEDRPENRANDVKVDNWGRVWVGTMAYDKRPRHAALYRVDGDNVTRVVEGLTISNGPALDESRGRLYLADTGICVVDAFDMDTGTGAVSGRRRFLDFNEAQVWPDGMTVDDEGMLWVALGRAGAVHRYRADGTLDGVVELPTTNPTSVAFGGNDGGDLYITTSWVDIDADRRAAQPLAGAIFRCRPGVTGRPSPRYAGIPTVP